MRDQYIGIDLHKAFFQACAVSPAGDRLWEGRFPRTPAGLEALTARCTTRSALAVEASTPTWHFADDLVGAVGDLRIVDPLKTKLKAGFAAKTDRLDAQRLADALRRDSVVGIYYPPLAIRELRELCRMRHALVQVRTALINRVRAVLLRQGIADARRLARASDDRGLASFTLPARATESVAALRAVLSSVRTEAARAEAHVREATDADPIAITLQQLRGVGPVLALTIRAEIGDIHRFPTGTPGKLRGARAACRDECGTVPVWADHQTRVAVAALGADRGGHAWDETLGSDRAVGPGVGGQERRAQSPCRVGTRALSRDPSVVGHSRVTPSPGRCRRDST